MKQQVVRDRENEGQEIVFEMTLNQAIESIVERTVQEIENLDDTLTLPAPRSIQVH